MRWEVVVSMLMMKYRGGTFCSDTSVVKCAFTRSLVSVEYFINGKRQAHFVQFVSNDGFNINITGQVAAIEFPFAMSIRYFAFDSGVSCMPDS